jgi:hypothetical protein
MFDCDFGRSEKLTENGGVILSHLGYYVHMTRMPTVSKTVIFI